MIYVVIPHYIISDEIERLALKTIESFRKTGKVIIVSVDDSSPIKSERLIKASDYFLQRNENGGFAKCINDGIRLALAHKAEYIVCANNDIEVFGNWFEEAKELFDRFNAAIVGGLGFRGKIVEGKPIEEYATNQNSKYKGTYISEGGQLEDWLFPGGYYIARRETFEKYGIYDESYQHGGYEDVDLFYRIKQEGGKLIMTPKIWYWHKEGATRFSEMQKGIQDIAEPLNRKYFKEKWGFDYRMNLGRVFKEKRINL